MSQLTIKEFQEQAKRTRPDLGSELNNNLHMTIGIATEAGELLDVYKKAFAYGKKIDVVNVKEEIGDLLWYIVNQCDINGFDIEEIMHTNIMKLLKRFPEKFDADAAIFRNTDAERVILEEKEIKLDWCFPDESNNENK